MKLIENCPSCGKAFGCTCRPEELPDCINENVHEDKREVKIIPTGMSPEYVKDWDVIMAIREILQNYLDSKLEFGCDGSIVWEDGLAKVKDNGPGIELKHLAMGISEKGLDSIGKFGEGIKLAMLVMAREGRKIEVWSNKKIIMPVIKFSEDYQTETLEFHMKDMHPRHAAKFIGTSIKFRCTEDELDTGRAFFIDLRKKSEKPHWLVKDQISRPGEIIYVNRAAVGTIENARFSYHISGTDGLNIGNRDRSTINQDDVTPLVRRMLVRSRNMEVIETILHDIEDGENTYETKIGLNYHMASAANKKIWKRAINRVFGKTALISSEDLIKNRQAEYRGFNVKNLGYLWNNILAGMGMDSVDNKIEEREKKVKIIKFKDLDEDEKTNLMLAMNLVEEHYHKVGEVVIAESLQEKAGMSEGREAEGLWVSSEQKIYLRRLILTDQENTLHTLLHETVHKVSGDDDCTSEFEVALLNVAVKMMLKG